MTREADSIPLDEWLKFSDTEIAERQRQQSETEFNAPEVETGNGHNTALPNSQPPDSREKLGEPPRTATLDEVHALAESLTHVGRLKLAARLWRTMPPTFRSALLQLELEDIQNPPRLLPDADSEPSGTTLRRFLFDRTNTSELYSAPRRFDLATIFVVTAAYSLLLGGLSALDAVPAIKIVAVGLLSLVAAGQALFHEHANPRGVSVLIGAAAYTLFTLVMWALHPRWFPNSFFFVIVVNGFMFGGFLGYIAGVLVGGMFLVAERLRGKLSPQETIADEFPDPQDSSPDPGEGPGEEL